MILAGTGHRPDKLGGYADDVRLRLEAFAETQLVALRPERVISGMALGWDQALAVAAVTLGIPLIAAVPFAEQAAAWPEGSQLRYRNLLAEAAEVHTICPPGYAGWKMQQRNNWMVIKSDVLLALWNGTSGGTANCVSYDKKNERKIVNVWDEWERFVDARTDRG